MEVKRAFRKYLGPDDPGPFSDIINSMSFGCRHMKEFNRNGVFCLNGSIPEGRVRVMRVGDIDYIWTFGGTTGALYIILIPDLVRGFVIPVSLSKDDYSFLKIREITVDEFLRWNVLRYEFGLNTGGVTGQGVSQQYMPYVSKRSDIHHASVGHSGTLSYLDPVNDWHYKFYTLDFTGEQSPSETIWRPPSQLSIEGTEGELLPLWYSMSPFTSHGYHWCLEAAIDQQKRTYQPWNTDVTLLSEEITIPDFTILTKTGTRYNFLYPLKVNRFFGKNAFTLDGSVMAAFGGSIYVSGVAETTIPSGIDPILYFWPWAPYLDEIRSFDILSYSGKTELGEFKGWYLYPLLNTFNQYKIQYYSVEGALATTGLLFSDAAVYSDTTVNTSGSNTSNPTGCGCGDCGTGIWVVNSAHTTNEYRSSGTKHVPIGLIGINIPIYMKTVWEQIGSGPTGSRVNTNAITGNYPYQSTQEYPYPSLADFAISCCIFDYSNAYDQTITGSEAAQNEMTLLQELRVGDDLIFSGRSTMQYNMTYSFGSNYNATANGTVIPPDFEHTCAGDINFTTHSMSTGEQQTLSWNDLSDTGVDPCGQLFEKNFRWALSGGGSLSSLTSQTTIYTAPESNDNCTDNATISLYCNDVLLDTLSIGITDAATNPSTMAYYYKWTEVVSGYCIGGSCGVCGGLGRKVHCNRYNCFGDILSSCTQSGVLCCFPPTCNYGCDNTTAVNCGGAYWDQFHDIRSAAMIAAGCCPGDLI